MKKTIIQLSSLVSLVIVLMVSVQAHTSAKYRAQIPFDFNVGKLKLPAGDYFIEFGNPLSSERSLTIQDAKSLRTIIVLVTPKESTETNNVSKLVFNHYGDHYF